MLTGVQLAPSNTSQEKVSPDVTGEPPSVTPVTLICAPSAAVVALRVVARVFSVNSSGALVPVLPAASVSLATMLWLPLPASVTVLLQAPPLPTLAVPSAVVLPLSNSVTVVPMSATSTVPDIVWLVWLVGPPRLVIATTGAVVSSVNVSDAVPVLPARSVSLATMVCDPSDRPLGVNDQTPAPFAIVVPRTVVPSFSVTTALASPDPVSASFDVILSAGDAPVSVTRLSATTGAVVSSVKVSDAVPVLPNVSVWLATMVCAPSARPLGVNDHAPWAVAVTVLAIGLPSIVKCTTVLARPVPVSASLEVMRSVLEAPVSNARLSVTVGAVVLSVKTTGVLVPVLPAASVSLATMLWLPLPASVTVLLQAPPLPTLAVPSAVVLPLSNSVTVVPMAATSTVPDIGWLVWLVGPPRLVIATTGAVVSSVNVSDAVPVLPARSVSLATMVCDPSDRPLGVNDQTPAPFAIVVPRTVVPSFSVT